MATRIDQIVDALFSNSSGATAPVGAEVGMSWMDTSSTPYRLRVWDGVQWPAVGSFNPTTGRFEPYTAWNAGSARPQGAIAGTPWLKTNSTPWVLNLFDGTDDIPLLNIDIGTNIASVVGGSGGFTANHTWQNVLSSPGRTHSTPYQNTTGRIIAAYIRASASVGRPIELSTNGTSGWEETGFVQNDTSVPNMVLIPNTSFIRINGSCTILTWRELR